MKRDARREGLESSDSAATVSAPPLSIEGAVRSIDVTRMQAVDGLLGPLLCLLATVVHRIFPRPVPEGAPQSIVFIKLGEQGATVLAAPAIREATRRVGSSRVYYVTFAGNREILDLMDLIPAENVLEIANTSVSAFLDSLPRILIRLWRLRLDAAIDLDFFTRASALLSWLTGAPRRVGLHPYFGEGPYRGDLITHRCRYNPHWHTARFFLALVHALDQATGDFPSWHAPIEDDSLRLPPVQFPATTRRAAQRLVLETLGLSSLPVIVLLNANCSDLVPLRKWMPERYVELARQILDRHPEVHILFTGSSAEAAATGQLAAAVGSDRCRSIGGKTTLAELLAIYDLAAVLVTNDSGPVHFACLTQVKTVALFGPETPALFGPLAPSAIALTAALPCSPCVSAQNSRQSLCRDNVCMRAITVETVYAAVASLLPTPTAGPPSPAAAEHSF